jgi:hypothetical protein
VNITRLVELSLYYKIPDSLSRTRVKEKPKSANFKVYNLKYNNIQVKHPIHVYVNGMEFNKNSYSVDNINGIVTLNTPITMTDVVEVTYTYCPVNIYDESTSPQSSDFKYPAVAIYEMDRVDEAIELGSNKKEKHPTWVFEVWSDRGGERNDITDDIMDMFEEGNIPVIDYNVNFPINSDGTINTNFDEITQTIGFMYCDSINYTKGGSLDIGEKPKYLSEIMADLTINI